MGLSYPTAPCTVPYNMGQLCSATLADFKQIADKSAVQIEMTLKPTSLKIRIIKRLDKDRVKKAERTFENADIEHTFNPAVINSMIADVCNPYN